MSRQEMTRRRFLGTTAMAGVASALPGPATAQSASTIKVRLYRQLQVLDPLTRLSAPEGDVMEVLLPGLVTTKPGDTWAWELYAATSIEQVDARHIKFELRRGMGWTNGFGEVTADDVKFSYERIAKPENKSPYHGDWKALDRVDVTGSHTGVIVLKEPFLPLFGSTLSQGSGCIVCRKAVEKLDGQRFGLEPPATFGPYKIKRSEPRVKLVVDRWEGWSGPRPDFDEVEFIPIEDANTAENVYMAGELDLTLLPMTAVPRLQKAMPQGSKLSIAPALAFWWLGMQMESGIFADKRVRKAVQHAVDVQTVLDGAFFGVAQRSTGIVAPGLIGHRPKNAIEKPNLDAARKLLAEAGHPRGFKIEIAVRNSAEFTSAGQVVAASLAQVGIQAEVAPYDLAALRAMVADKAGGWKKMQMHIVRFSMTPDPSWATVWFTKDQIGEWNWERFVDAEYNELHEKALAELDAQKRHMMYVRMQDIMEESGAYIFLTHGVNPILHRTNFVPAMHPDNNRMIVQKFKRA